MRWLQQDPLPTYHILLLVESVLDLLSADNGQTTVLLVFLPFKKGAADDGGSGGGVEGLGGVK